MTLRTLCLVRSAFLFLRWKFKLVPGTGDSLVPGTKREMARLCEPCHYVGAQKRLGHTGATPASVASDALRVLARSMLRFSGHEKGNGPLMRAMFLNWCPEEDSNLHTLRHTDLNRARLPIPPSGLRFAEGAQLSLIHISEP